MAVNTTILNDVIFAQEALLPFAAQLAPIAKFSKNFSDQFAAKGDRVRVPVIGTPDASKDFGSTGDYTDGAGGSVDAVDVTLTIHKYQTIDITEKQILENAVDVIPDLLKAKAQKLGEDVVSEMLAVVKASAFATSVSCTLDAFGHSTLATVAGVMTKARVPRGGRVAVLDSSWYEKIVADKTIAASFVSEVSRNAIVDGLVTRAAGMNLFESNAMPDNGENLVGFAASPAALAVASRYIQPVEGCISAQRAVDPETGLVLGYRRFADQAKGKMYITIECLAGIKVVSKSALCRIVEATAVASAQD